MFLITCARWFLAVKGKIMQFEVSVLALPTTTSSSEEFFQELLRLCTELKDANREFNHVTSHGLTLSLCAMICLTCAGAILPIAIKGTFALVFGVFLAVTSSSILFGFLFYASGVGEQYARAAGRIEADPGFILALANRLAAGKEVEFQYAPHILLTGNLKMPHSPMPFTSQGAGPGVMRALTSADIAFRFFGYVSLDYTKVMGVLLSIVIAVAFTLGPAVVEYL